MSKIVIAPDSFKGSLSAAKLADIVEKAAKERFPRAVAIKIPIADGGEGTLEALLMAVGGEKKRARVTGPDGKPLWAEYARLSDGSFAIELAQCAALTQMQPLDPMRATTLGVGELMRAALRDGARKLRIGIGGSATNDGGMGLLSGLGMRFLDAEGRELYPCGASLGKVARLDDSGLDARLKAVEITVLCDVSNPLLGESGAARVYAPQKGADAAMVEALEAGMAHYASVLGRETVDFPGAGAAGGVGAALGGVLGAKMRPGIDVVLEMANFDAHLADCALVITGEGRMDGQSVKFGKAAAGVAARAGNVPVVALVGGIGPGGQAFEERENRLIVPIVDGPMPLAQSMREAERLAYAAARRLFGALRMGMLL